MPTLLLRCAAPLQSWDTQSRFGVRTTGQEPSKSGIVGLFCAALGRPRREPVDDLAALRLGVRVDRQGSVLRDWHTAGMGGYLKASGAIERRNLITSTRYYLSDAAFLVGVEGDRALLELLHTALRDPHWMLFLGRKSCPPAAPVYLEDGLRDAPLLVSLSEYTWLGNERRAYERLQQVRVVLEDEKGAQVRQDQPISYEKGNRRYAPRRVSTHFIDKPPFSERDRKGEQDHTGG